MPAYKGMTQEQLRERIRNERRIELAFEDHRFFDERRWKLFEGKSAATEKSEPRYKQVYNIYSVVVTPDKSQVYTYRNDNTILLVRSLVLRIITSQCLMTLTRRILT